MKRLWGPLLGLAALVVANAACAQTSFPTQNPAINAPGVVNMCPNSAGTAVPCSEITPLSAKIVPGAVISVPPYPVGAVPVGAVGAGSTAAVVGTLPAAPGRTTYLCNVDVSAIGGTAAVGPITIAGVNGGSLIYQGSASAAGGPVLTRTFTPCLPAATPNTAISITTTADGTATAVNVSASGFQL